VPCCASYSFMRRAKEIRGLLMRETYAAMGGISEMLPSAQSSFVRILMVLHESSGLCFWIPGPRILQRIKFLSWLEEAPFTTSRFGMGRGHEKTGLGTEF